MAKGSKALWKKMVLRNLLVTAVILVAIRILGPGLSDVLDGKILDVKLGMILAVVVGVFLGNMAVDRITALK